MVVCSLYTCIYGSQLLKRMSLSWKNCKIISCNYLLLIYAINSWSVMWCWYTSNCAIICQMCSVCDVFLLTVLLCCWPCFWLCCCDVLIAWFCYYAEFLLVIHIDLRLEYVGSTTKFKDGRVLYYYSTWISSYFYFLFIELRCKICNYVYWQADKSQLFG